MLPGIARGFLAARALVHICQHPPAREQSAIVGNRTLECGQSLVIPPECMQAMPAFLIGAAVAGIGIDQPGNVRQGFERSLGEALDHRQQVKRFMVVRHLAQRVEALAFGIAHLAALQIGPSSFDQSFRFVRRA